MTDRKKFIHGLLYAVLIYAVFIFQEMIFPRLRIFGAAPLLLPIVAAGCGLLSGRMIGCIVGFFCGALCDLSFPETTATFIIVLSFLGLFTGYLSETVLSGSLPAFAVCCFFALLLCAFVSAFPFAVFGNTSLSAIWPTAAAQTLYSLLFVLPLYYPVRAVCLY